MKRLCLMICVAALMGTSPAFAASKQKKVTADTNFLMLPPLTASVGGPYRFSGIMNIEIGLVIKDEDLRAYAEQIAPRLRAAHNQALTRFSMSYYRPGTVPDVETLARNLQRATDEALGKEGAELLMGSVIVN